MLAGRLVALRRVVVFGWGLGLAATWTSWVWTPEQGPIRLALFLATLAAQVAALGGALLGRAALDREDPSRRAFTAIGLGLGLRLFAELRLLTLYLGVVPEFIRADPDLAYFYVQGLRYLYAAADLAFLGGFVVALRSLASTGLEFRMRARDLGVVALLVPLPFAVYFLHALTGGSPDPNLATFRLVGATVDATVTAVCVALASAALQMGGGAWAWIWGAAAVGGIARALAFVAAAAAPLVPVGILIEQSLLWTFACAWLLATALHLRLVR